MSKFGELVLVAGDSFIPYRSDAIPELFMKMLIPGKFKHVLLTGNLCTQREIDFFRSICDDVVVVKGTMDDVDSLPAYSMKTIGGYNILSIGEVHISQPSDEMWQNYAKGTKANVIVTGETHKLQVEQKDGILHLNPGSITGAFHPSSPQNLPSFLLLAIHPEEITVFTYQIKDGKLDVGKSNYKKNM